MDIFQLGLQGVIAYGFIGFISMVADKRGIAIDSQIKFTLLLGVAFGVGFIPAEFGNLLLTHIKDAVGVALAINAANTGLNKIGGN